MLTLIMNSRIDMEWHELERIAIRELQEEEKRKKIDEIKKKLKNQKPKKWWNKYIPYRIVIEKIK